jgi:hypothetical protein
MATSNARKGAQDLGKKPVHKWPEGLQVGFDSLTTKKVKRAKSVPDVVAVAARHNLRMNNKDHRHRALIDPTRAHLNSVLEGDSCPERVAQNAIDTLARLGLAYPGRVDAVAAFEVVIKPPDGWDNDAFWAAAMAWVRGRYEHVISAAVHRDQTRPHAHILALPVLGGCLAGREMQRGKWCVPAMREDFLAHMLKTLNLRPGMQESPLTPWALSAGAGPARRDVAARRDAAHQSFAVTPKNGGDIEAGHCTDVPYVLDAMSSNEHCMPVSNEPAEWREMVFFEAPANAGKKQGADGMFGGVWMGHEWRESFMAAAAVLA